jgi:GTP-binding protein
MGLWHLVDLPGYGFASASKKELIALREMVADYLSESPRIALCLLIVDSRIGMTPLDVDIAQQLQSAKLPFIIIANKIDKLSHSERAQQLSLIERQFSGVKVIPHSTVTHEGKGLILDEMHRMIKEASPLEPME